MAARRKGSAGARPVVIAAALAVALALGAGFYLLMGGAAEPPEPSGPVTAADITPAGTAEAADAARIARLNCQVQEGYRLRLNLYEVVCADGPGYLVLMRGELAGDGYDCLSAQAKMAGTDAGWPLPGVSCRLPGNRDQAAKLRPWLAEAGSSCIPTGARSVQTPIKGFFAEVSCKDNPGLLLEVRPFSKPVVNSCLDYVGGADACRLTGKPAMLGWLAKVAMSAGRTCAATDFRYLAYRSTGEAYYELACGSAPGIVLQTTPDGGEAVAMTCAAAREIGGGCTFKRAA